MKGKLCFIKRKSKDLVSSGRGFCEKNVSIFEGRERLNKDLWTFLRNVPSFLFFLSAFFRKDACSFAHRLPHCFLIRTSVRANGHAPAYRALSEFAISAFTLHLHPQFVDTVYFSREGNALFFAFTGEGNKGEAFTRKSLHHCFLQSYGEGKKRKTAARTRLGLRWEAGALLKKVLPVVDVSFQMSDEPISCCVCIVR